MRSELLQRNFALSIKVDQCKMTLTVAIEKLTFELLLLDYDWGKDNVNKDSTLNIIKYENKNIIARKKLISIVNCNFSIF